MPFPEVPRVRYAKNPLDKVICQLRFPPILRIESELPARYQDNVRSDYPHYRKKSLNQPPNEMKNQLPPEIAKLMFDSGAGGQAYEFTSDDGEWIITLTKDFIALTANNYVQWDEFEKHLEKPLQLFVDEYKPSFYSRIGLRYQNVIRKSELGLEDAHWSELLESHIAGILAAPEIEDRFIEEVAHNEVIKLDIEKQSFVRIIHRFVTAMDNNELCYLIDNDFYTEQRTEIGDAIETLNFFNRRARRLFRWCISERLHEAMEPEKI